MSRPAQGPDLDSALSRAPVRPSQVTSKFVESLGCAEKEEKTGVGEAEVGKRVREIIETKPQIELGAPVCHPAEKMGKFERDLEELRLKRQSLVVCDNGVKSAQCSSTTSPLQSTEVFFEHRCPRQ